MSPSSILMLLLCGLSSMLTARGNVHIGNGLYLPDTDLMNPINSQRTIFDLDLNNSRYIREEKLSQVRNTKVFSKDSESVYKQLSGTFGLTAPIKVVQLSLRISYTTIAGGDREVTALSIDVLTYSRKMSVLNEARAPTNIPLRKDFISELGTLPLSPQGDTNWAPYRSFMRKWGSHYVTSVYFGSWLQQWTSSESSRKYSERDLQAKACASLEGVASKFASVEGCAGVTRENKEEASQLTTTDRLVVRGGEPDTLSKLASGQKTNELIQKFIQEGRSTSAPVVGYEFTPIWTQVLQQYASSSNEYKIASAMQAYYEGFLAFGCPRDALTNPVAVLQEFRFESNRYKCVRRCEGCLRDKDCNLSGISGCKCYGNSCIYRTPDNRAAVQTSPDSLPVDQGPNRSCQYTFPSCNCNTQSKEANCVNNYATIWDQATSRMQEEALVQDM